MDYEFPIILGISENPNCYSLHHFSEGLVAQPPTTITIQNLTPLWCFWWNLSHDWLYGAGVTLWLWLTVCHGFSMALIEIDGLPLKNGDFPWQTVSHNQMVSTYLGLVSYDPKSSGEKAFGSLQEGPKSRWWMWIYSGVYGYGSIFKRTSFGDHRFQKKNQ